jgi:hypothetical protein
VYLLSRSWSFIALLVVIFAAGCSDAESDLMIPGPPSFTYEPGPCILPINCQPLQGSQYLLVSSVLAQYSGPCTWMRDWLTMELNNGGILTHNYGSLGIYWAAPVPRISLDFAHFQYPWDTHYQIGNTLFHEAAHHFYGADESNAISIAASCG